jgi:hypothetical protein
VPVDVAEELLGEAAVKEAEVPVEVRGGAAAREAEAAEGGCAGACGGSG